MTVFPLQICHFLLYSQVPSGRVGQWGTKSAPGVFSQKEAPSSLHTRIPPGLQKKKERKKKKRVSASKFECTVHAPDYMNLKTIISCYSFETNTCIWLFDYLFATCMPFILFFFFTWMQLLREFFFCLTFTWYSVWCP